MATKVAYEVLYWCKTCKEVVKQAGTLKMYMCWRGHLNSSTNGTMKEVMNGDLGSITKIEKEMKSRNFKPYIYVEEDLWDDNETLRIRIVHR